MKLDHLNQWLAVIANFGVLIGIIFLVIEINQSNRIAITESEIAIWNNFSSINEMIISNDQLATIFLKSQTEEKLTPVEYVKYMAFIRRLLNVWGSIERGYQNGMITEETYRVHFEDIRGSIPWRKDMQDMWRTTLDNFSSQEDSANFVFIREILDERSGQP